MAKSVLSDATQDLYVRETPTQQCPAPALPPALLGKPADYTGHVGASMRAQAVWKQNLEKPTVEEGTRELLSLLLQGVWHRAGGRKQGSLLSTQLDL